MAVYTASFGSGNTLQLTLTETINANNNTSTIHYDVRVLGNGYSVANNNSLNLTLNNALIFNGNPGTVTNNVPIAVGDFVYTHNSDGTGSFPVSCVYSTVLSSGAVTATISSSFTCQTIGRQSTISTGNGTVGLEQFITVTRASTSYTHTITYRVGNASGTIVTKSSNTNISWTPPVSLAAQNTTSKTLTCTLTCTTYNGNTSLGNTTKTISIAIPSSIRPASGTATIQEVGQSTFSGKYVQNLSKVRLTWTLSTANAQGATVKTAGFVINGTTYSMSISTSGTTVTCVSLPASVTASGTVTWSAYAIDSRGYTTTESGSISVYAYNAPGITSATIARCDSSGTESSNGTYAKVVLSCAYSTVGGSNSISGSISYLDTSETFSTTPVTKIIGGGRFSTNSSYTITVSVTDTAGRSARVTLQLPSEFVLMDFHSSGTGMAIGKVATTADLLEVDLETNFNKPVTQFAPSKSIKHNGSFSNNQTGYIKLLEITVTGQNASAPMGFDFIQRMGFGTVWVELQNISNLQPTLISAKSIGWLQEVQVDRSVSGDAATFGIWVKKSESYDNVALMGMHMSSFQQERVEISLMNSFSTSPGGTVATVYRPTAV